MTDDDVIDLERYRTEQAHQSDGMGLSLLGAEGDYRHFALPLWRMATVVGANWAGLIRASGGRECTAVTVVDLGAYEPRPMPPGGMPGDPHIEPPGLIEEPGGALIVAVGRPEGDGWFVVLDGRESGAVLAGEREDLLFLAGECSGLLALLGEEADDQP